MGPWPLFYFHTSFSSGSKCGISFMDVDPETFKLVKKMGKPNKGHNSKSYGPLAPILLPHLLFFRDHMWYKFHGSRTTNVENIQQNVKSRNYGIMDLQNYGMEGHGKSNIAPLFHSWVIKMKEQISRERQLSLTRYNSPFLHTISNLRLLAFIVPEKSLTKNLT